MPDKIQFLPRLFIPKLANVSPLWRAEQVIEILERNLVPDR